MLLTLALPLLLGVSAIGIRLGRTLQATQLTRDVAHMYALGADFSLAGTQSIAATLSRDFQLTSTGKAVLIFSRIMKVQQTDCTAAGLSNCPNLNQPVFVQRLVLGNSTLRSSAFGTPASSYIGSKGLIAGSNYCAQSSLVATGFDAVLNLGAGQSAWMVEGYFSMPDINFLNFADTQNGYYARFVF